jgi:PD-(D/E)XK nuclease superfamily
VKGAYACMYRLLQEKGVRMTQRVYTKNICPACKVDIEQHGTLDFETCLRKLASRRKSKKAKVGHCKYCDTEHECSLAGTCLVNIHDFAAKSKSDGKMQVWGVIRMTQRIYTDRSRIETFMRCPRKRFIEYHQGGMGVVPARTPLPLAVGGSVHEGLAELLRRAQALYDQAGKDWDLNPKALEWMEDEAVRVALADFEQYTKAGLELDAFERAAMQTAAPAQVASPDGATYEQQLLAQARDLGMSEAEVAQYAESLARGKTAGTGEFDRWLEAEQRALVEAMVRAYARRRLRPLLEEFEVLEVEREGEWKLGDYTKCVPNYEGCCLRCEQSSSYKDADWKILADCPNGYEVWFLSRPDALLRERATNQLYILSFKTTSQWDIRKEKNAQHDMQGLTEGVEIERRLGEWWQQVNQPGSYKDALGFNIETRMYQFLKSLPEPPRILGIRYEFLLKGERWKDKDLSARFGMDVRSQRTPLLRQYVAVSTPKRGEAGYQIGDVCASWDFLKEDGSKGQLSWQNWKSQPVWEGGDASVTLQSHSYQGGAVARASGVKNWIDMLDASFESMSPHDPTVGLPPRPLGWKGPAQAVGYTEQHPLDACFVPPIIVIRNDDDLRDLFESIEHQERGVAEAVAQVAAAGDDGERRSVLNKEFPQFRHSCEYPSTCAFVGVCYSVDASVRDNPVGSGLYKIRVPNHPQESKESEK